ncbi:MAG: hypothetical protein U5K28_05775 [Halobacteriales archaeon]|nr:hypothetical protein [Halobacteriales archaeon]
MGSDGLIDIDQSCWQLLAKYNLLLATVFGAITLTARMTDAGTLLVVENGVLAIVFGALQTYAWLSA